MGSRGRSGCFGTSLPSSGKLSHGAAGFELVTSLRLIKILKICHNCHPRENNVFDPVRSFGQSLFNPIRKFRRAGKIRYLESTNVDMQQGVRAATSATLLPGSWAPRLGSIPLAAPGPLLGFLLMKGGDPSSPRKPERLPHRCTALQFPYGPAVAFVNFSWRYVSENVCFGPFTFVWKTFPGRPKKTQKTTNPAHYIF